MSRSDMLRMAKQCASLGGVRGHAPENFFLKWCNLVRFGVYLDQILTLKNFKNYHFYAKKFKIAIFIKKINILDTYLPRGNSRNEIFFKHLRLMRFDVYFEIILNRKWLFSCRNTY